jgi:SPP1 gp7 family putative phage head morphogenesis protein
MEVALHRLIRDWSTKALIRMKNEFIRDQDKVKKTEMVGSVEELQRVLTRWYLRSYQDNYKAETGSVAVGPELSKVLERAEYQAADTARKTYSHLQAQFYDSTRDFMAKLKRHQARYGVEAPGAYIRRQLEGLPGPSPYQRAGVPEPPSYRFKGKKLRTFGSNGVNGSRDPYQVAARARTIARTELTQARNAAKAQGFEKAGIKYVRWVSFHDFRTRESHADLDGEIRPVGELFEWQAPGRGTVSAVAPGDMSLPAEERINCRCTIVSATAAQYKAQQRGRG